MPENEELFQLDPEKLEKAIFNVSRLLNSKGLYQKILYKWTEPTLTAVKSEMGMKFHPSPAESATLEAVESALAVYSVLSEALDNRIMQQEVMKDTKGRIAVGGLKEGERAFVNLYSLYAACAEGISCLEPYLKQLPAENLNVYDGLKDACREGFEEVVNQEKLLVFTSEYPKFLESIIKEYAEKFIPKLGKKVFNNFEDDRDFMGLTYLFFTTVLDYVKSELKKKEYETLLKEYLIPVKLPHTTVKDTGFSLSLHAEGGEQDTGGIQLDTDFKDVVGNVEAIYTIRGILSKLFMYDPSTKSNPYLDFVKLPRTSLLFAHPGTGKTMMVKAAVKYCVELAEKTGKKFNPVVIDQRFKNEFYGKSEEKLEELFNKATSPDGIGLIIMEDIDSLFTNRSTDQDNSRAETNALSYMLNRLEGTKTEYYGNWLVICTTNRAHQVDKALYERISQVEFYCPGPQTPDEYTRLVGMQVDQAVKKGYMKIAGNEWEKIAEVCVDKKYSGRQIRNAVVELITEATNFEIDLEGIAKLKTESEFQDFLLRETRNRMGKDYITADDIIKKLEDVVLKEETKINYDKNERIKDLSNVFYERQRAEDLAMERIRKERLGVDGSRQQPGQAGQGGSLLDKLAEMLNVTQEIAALQDERIKKQGVTVDNQGKTIDELKKEIDNLKKKGGKK